MWSVKRENVLTKILVRLKLYLWKVSQENLSPFYLVNIRMSQTWLCSICVDWKDTAVYFIFHYPSVRPKCWCPTCRNSAYTEHGMRLKCQCPFCRDLAWAVHGMRLKPCLSLAYGMRLKCLCPSFICLLSSLSYLKLLVVPLFTKSSVLLFYKK